MPVLIAGKTGIRLPFFRIPGFNVSYFLLVKNATERTKKFLPGFKDRVMEIISLNENNIE